MKVFGLILLLAIIVGAAIVILLEIAWIAIMAVISIVLLGGIYVVLKQRGKKE